jgi:transposase
MLGSADAPRAARIRNKATESMTTTYSPEFKASIIARMLPPNNVPVPDLVRETNIPKDTLYAWRAKARREAQGVAAASAPTSGLSSEEKFAVVVQTAVLNEVELGEYCRGKGLYPQEIAAWRARCLQANAVVSAKAERAELRAQKQQIKTLQRELQRKDKALAEAAALLVLEKKAQRLFGEPEDARSSWSSERA